MIELFFMAMPFYIFSSNIVINELYFKAILQFLDNLIHINVPCVFLSAIYRGDRV